MGTVIINGKRYDSVSGLMLDEFEPDQDSLSEIMKNAVEHSTAEMATANKRQSKQERLAEAIAQEFEIENSGEIQIKDEVQTTGAENASIKENSVAVPDWVRQFAEDHAALRSSANSVQTEQVEKMEQIEHAEQVTTPDWISNFADGGAPIEIQPIGLEAAARQAEKEAAKIAANPTMEIARTAPQNHRAHMPERSRTLNRNFVEKPHSVAQVGVRHRTTAPVATHPEVRHFSPTSANIMSKAATSIAPVKTAKSAEPIQSKSVKVKPEIADDSFAPVMMHRVEENFAQREIRHQAPKPTNSDIKNALIAEQFNQPIDRKSRRRAEKQAARQSRRRFAVPTLITAALAVLVLGGYFTYVNMPNISIRVAASRAGIETNAPYMPNGYSIDGPVAYAPGQITIHYKSNAGAAGYSITGQKNSSSATTPEPDDYEILDADGTAVYRSGNQVTWTNNSVVYTLDSNGLLSDDQIENIAKSV